MKKKGAAALILAGILTVICYGAIRERNIIRPTYTSIEAAQVEEGFFGRVDILYRFEQNTVYLAEMPEEPSRVINYDALADHITFEYEPVTNGIFVKVSNDSGVGLGCVVGIEGKEQRIPFLPPKGERLLFYDLDPYLFNNGFTINGKGNREKKVSVTITASVPDPEREVSELKYAIEESEVSKKEYEKALELKEKGYCSFLDDREMRGFILKYYCNGNLMAGSSMETSDWCRFGEGDRCFAVPSPEGIEADAIEMEYYY